MLFGSAYIIFSPKLCHTDNSIYQPALAYMSGSVYMLADAQLETAVEKVKLEILSDNLHSESS